MTGRRIRPGRVLRRRNQTAVQGQSPGSGDRRAHRVTRGSSGRLTPGSVRERPVGPGHPGTGAADHRRAPRWACSANSAGMLPMWVTAAHSLVSWWRPCSARQGSGGLQLRAGSSAAASACSDRGTWRARQRRRQCTTKQRRNTVRGLGSQATVTSAVGMRSDVPGPDRERRVAVVADRPVHEAPVGGVDLEHACAAGPGHARGTHQHDELGAGQEPFRPFEHVDELGVPAREAVDVGEQGEHLVGRRADQGGGGGVGMGER